MEKGLLRLVDANANRAREGLRVVEDVARLLLDDESTASRLKNLRHRLTELCAAVAPDALLLAERDSESDLGRKATFDSKGGAGDVQALVSRNMRRSQEACRVLEEVSCLVDQGLRGQFKELRYMLYDAEKAVAERL
jgi:thiamine-phosphate pyrophosphorylase